eukprot:1054398-Rhodomonas_salina.1
MKGGRKGQAELVDRERWTGAGGEEGEGDEQGREGSWCGGWECKDQGREGGMGQSCGTGNRCMQKLTA